MEQNIRQISRQIKRQRYRNWTDRSSDIQREIEIVPHTEKERQGKTDQQTNRQISRPRDRQTDG